MARERNDELRLKILDKAFALFLEKGYKNVSMKEIAVACDIKPSLAQYYFAKKEYILVQVFFNKLKWIGIFIKENLMQKIITSAESPTCAFVCAQYSLFYDMLTRNNDRLLYLYSEILFNAPLLNKATDFAVLNFGGDHRISFNDTDQRLGLYLLNGFLSQILSLHLSRRSFIEFNALLRRALETYMQFVQLSQDQCDTIMKNNESILTQEVKDSCYSEVMIDNLLSDDPTFVWYDI